MLTGRLSVKGPSSVSRTDREVVHCGDLHGDSVFGRFRKLGDDNGGVYMGMVGVETVSKGIVVTIALS
jgi:hypothetical protein